MEEVKSRTKEDSNICRLGDIERNKHGEKAEQELAERLEDNQNRIVSCKGRI